MVSHLSSSAQEEVRVFSSNLIQAMKDNKESEFQGLLFNACGVSRDDHHGRLPLTWAVQHNRSDYVKILLNHNASVNLPSLEASCKGYTPLFLAVANKNEEVATLLLDAGASVDLLSDNRTPLFLAVQDENLKMIELLLRYHANPHAVCALRRGYFESPFSFALRVGSAEASSLLLEAQFHHLVSLLSRASTKKISIHKNSVQVMQETLETFADQASEESPLEVKRTKIEQSDPIINKSIPTFDWIGDIKAAAVRNWVLLV
ncbi:Ankyrin repeat domain-containing protein 20A4 [Penicillium subrubescens]|uniref:Ankyrin repeat domain-containing protein 20A4 n=1 Tax=Penicillium subrubescens TaxID=1316194 RepID=A0A1Q5TD04_9EURO|nr:Ankyrin repeat domain-containing protein 20A4 [Penicillium subrubescens]